MPTKSKKNAKAAFKTTAKPKADKIIVPKILPPKVDVVFKMLFGDKRNTDILSDFIKVVLHLGDGELKEIFLIDTHLKKETIDDKLSILDVKAKLSNGKIIDIEIQVRSVPEMRSRITYYEAKMLTEQIGESGSYLDIKPAIVIVIADFPLIAESKACHTKFQMLEVKEHFPFNDLQEINVLDLTKVGAEKDKDLYDWLKFIGAESEEDIMRAAKRNPAIRTAFGRLKVLSADKQKRMLYEARLKAKRDQLAFENAARSEGLAEGKAKGIKIGEARGEARILDLLKQGMSYKQILAQVQK